MKTLKLTIKKKWFDMIIQGEKTSEYREIKDHWCRRFLFFKDEIEVQAYEEFISLLRAPIVSPVGLKELFEDYSVAFRSYDLVEFTNGYGNDKPQVIFECRGITIGKGNVKWGAPAEDVFIIQLGKEVSRANVK